MAGQTFKAPVGLRPRRWTRRTTTCTSRCSSAKCKADGQFNVVWKTHGPDQGAAVEPVHRRQRQEEGRAGHDVTARTIAQRRRRNHRRRCSSMRRMRRQLRPAIGGLVYALLPRIRPSRARTAGTRSRTARRSATATRRSRRSRALVAEGDPEAAGAAEGARRRASSRPPASRARSCDGDGDRRRSTGKPDRGARTPRTSSLNNRMRGAARNARSPRSSSPRPIADAPRRGASSAGERRRRSLPLDPKALAEGDRSRDQGRCSR